MTGAEPLFLYGTLRHPPLYAAVAGESLRAAEARLDDHAICHAMAPSGRSLDFPLFTARPGAVAQGLLVHPGALARERLDGYERAFGYDPVPITVQHGGQPVRAQIYLPRAGLWQGGADWSLQAWVARAGALAVETVAEVMALLPDATPEAIIERYPMLKVRAASRLRARAEPAPATLRRQGRPGDVEVAAHHIGRDGHRVDGRFVDRAGQVVARRTRRPSLQGAAAHSPHAVVGAQVADAGP